MNILETLLNFTVTDINQIAWNTVSRAQSVSHPFTILADIIEFAKQNPGKFNRFVELHNAFLPILFTMLSNTDVTFKVSEAVDLMRIFNVVLENFPRSVPTNQNEMNLIYTYEDGCYVSNNIMPSIFDTPILGAYTATGNQFNMATFENNKKHRLLANAYYYACTGRMYDRRANTAVVHEEKVDTFEIDTKGLLGKAEKEYVRNLITIYHDTYKDDYPPELNDAIDEILNVVSYTSLVSKVLSIPILKKFFNQIFAEERGSCENRIRKAYTAVMKTNQSDEDTPNELFSKLKGHLVKYKKNARFKNTVEGKVVYQALDDYEQMLTVTSWKWTTEKVDHEASQSIGKKVEARHTRANAVHSDIAIGVSNCFTAEWPRISFSVQLVSEILTENRNRATSEARMNAQNEDDDEEDDDDYDFKTNWFVTVDDGTDSSSYSSSSEDDEDPAEIFIPRNFEEEYVYALGKLARAHRQWEGPTITGYIDFRNFLITSGFVNECGAPMIEMNHRFVQGIKPCTQVGKVTATKSNYAKVALSTMNLAAMNIIRDASNMDDSKTTVHARAIIMQLCNFLKMLLTRLFDYSHIHTYRQMIFETVDWSRFPLPPHYSDEFRGNFQAKLFETASEIIALCGNIQGVPCSSIRREYVNSDIMERYIQCDRHVHRLFHMIDENLPTLIYTEEHVRSLINSLNNDMNVRGMIDFIVTAISKKSIEQFITETTIENTMSVIRKNRAGADTFKFKSSMMSYYLLNMICKVFISLRKDFDFTDSELFSNNKFADVLRPKIIRPYDFQARFLNTIFDDINNFDLNLDTMLNFRMIDHIRFSNRFGEDRQILSKTIRTLTTYVSDWCVGRVADKHPNLIRNYITPQAKAFRACKWHFDRKPTATFTERIPFGKIFIGTPANMVNNLSTAIPGDLMISILNTMLNNSLDEVAAKKKYMIEVNRIILYAQRAALWLFCHDPSKMNQFFSEIFDSDTPISDDFMEISEKIGVHMGLNEYFQEERRMKAIIAMETMPNFVYNFDERLAELKRQYDLFMEFCNHRTRETEVMQEMTKIMHEGISTLHFKEDFLEMVHDKFAENNTQITCPTMHPFVKMLANGEQLDFNLERDYPQEFLEKTNYESAGSVYTMHREMTSKETEMYPALIDYLRKLQDMKVKCRLPYVDVEGLAVLLDQRALLDYTLGTRENDYFDLEFTDSGRLYVTSSGNPSVRVESIISANHRIINDEKLQDRSSIIYSPSRPKNIYVLNAMTNTGKTTLSIMLAKLIYDHRKNFSVVFVTDVEEIEKEVIEMMRSVGLLWMYASPETRAIADAAKKDKFVDPAMLEEARASSRLSLAERVAKRENSAEFLNCRFFIASAVEAKKFMEDHPNRRFIPFIDEPTATTGTIYNYQMMQLIGPNGGKERNDFDMEHIYNLIKTEDRTLSVSTRYKIASYISKCFACIDIIKKHNGLCVLSGSTVPTTDVLSTLNSGCNVKDFPLSRINMSVDVHSFGGQTITPLQSLPPDSHESLRKLNDCPLSKRLLSINRYNDYPIEVRAKYNAMVSFDQFTGQEILNYYMFTLYDQLKIKAARGALDEYFPDTSIDDMDEAIRTRRTTSESIVGNIRKIIPSLEAYRVAHLDRIPVVNQSDVQVNERMVPVPDGDAPINIIGLYKTKTIIFTDNPEKYAMRICFPDLATGDAFRKVFRLVERGSGILMDTVDTVAIEKAIAKIDRSRGKVNERATGQVGKSANNNLLADIRTTEKQNAIAERNNNKVKYDAEDATSFIQKYLMNRYREPDCARNMKIRLVTDTISIDKKYNGSYMLGDADLIISDVSGAYGLNIPGLENCIITDRFAMCNSTSTILQALSRVGREKHTVARASMSEFCMFKCALYALSNSSFIHSISVPQETSENLKDLYNGIFTEKFSDVDYSLFVNIVYATIKTVEHAFRLPDVDTPFRNCTSYQSIDEFVADYCDVSTMIFEDTPSRLNKEICNVLKKIVFPSLTTTQEARIIEAYRT